MRLILPLLFALIGIIAGAIATALFKRSSLSFIINAVIGVLGSFAGLLIRDFFDIQTGGKAGGAILAAMLGALLATLLINAIVAVFSQRS